MVKAAMDYQGLATVRQDGLATAADPGRASLNGHPSIDPGYFSLVITNLDMVLLLHNENFH